MAKRKAGRPKKRTTKKRTIKKKSTKKWGKIGAPKSAKRKAHMRKIAKKR